MWFYEIQNMKLKTKRFVIILTRNIPSKYINLINFGNKSWPGACNRAAIREVVECIRFTLCVHQQFRMGLWQNLHCFHIFLFTLNLIKCTAQISIEFHTWTTAIIYVNIYNIHLIVFVHINVYGMHYCTRSALCDK